MNQSVNSITQKIIGSAITIHKELGPGLLESSYEACMAYELAQMNLKVERQKGLPVIYREIKLD
jgi:GxxExxY protein